MAIVTAWAEDVSALLREASACRGRATALDYERFKRRFLAGYVLVDASTYEAFIADLTRALGF